MKPIASHTAGSAQSQAALYGHAQEDAAASAAATPAETAGLQEIDRLDAVLTARFAKRMHTDTSLDRRDVSFQANKSKAVYRWYKYKEGFSASLVEYLLNRFAAKAANVLDPFAGSGTTLFAASRLGIASEGIELLPIGQEIIAIRKLIEKDINGDIAAALARWSEQQPWRETRQRVVLPELPITRGAYPDDTKLQIEAFLAASKLEPPDVSAVLRFALLCILESVSFTRKDGQYLRWDYRSNRRQGPNPFNKGEILPFHIAFRSKIHEMLADLSPASAPSDLFQQPGSHGNITLHHGSCLGILPQLPTASYDSIITSPPYCNRYDYTRTYALELAILGIDEAGLSSLRQTMLTCTVENKLKSLLAINPNWKAAIRAADDQQLLQAVLGYLDLMKAQGELNNNGIPRMVRGYFYETACVIFECARLLKSGGRFMMVNDNVRYAGASISVDLILSALAEGMGLRVHQIMILPTGKGNSSQQMGEHGRDELRKCIYVWQKE